MELHWSNRISFKLARVAVIIAFAVGVVLSAWQVYVDYREEGGLLDEKVYKSLQATERAATRAVLILDSELAREVVSGLMEYEYIIEVAILSDDGNVLATDVRQDRAEGAGINYARLFFDDTVSYENPLALPNTMAERPGSLRVKVDRAIGLQPFFSRAITTFVSGVVRNFLLVMLLYFAFHRGLTQPLTQIVQQLSQINAEQPGEQRVHVLDRHKNDEVGLLANRINSAFDAQQVLLDNLRATNRALSASEETLRVRSLELEQEVERSRRVAMEMVAVKEQAEAASRAKSAFLANVSHELRTPLNAIIGFSSIMTDQIFGPIGHEKYTDYMHDIRSSSQHLSDVLGEVLDLAKIEAGQLHIDEEDVDIVKLCKESIALLATQATSKYLKIEQKIDEELPLLKGDRLKIKQSVLNLLSNAIKFTPEKGENLIVEAAVDNETGELCISVTDRGIGIAKEEQVLVFTPFMRASSAHSRTHEGTGLGLSLVQAFMDLHGGKVTVDSVPGKGSVFTLRFPLERILNQK